MVSIIVAQGRNRVIGREGRLPWHIPSDLRRFRELTTGHTVVMGRRTFDSLPASVRPLPDRHNVVLSRDPGYRPPEAVAVETSLRGAVERSGGACFVIGGGQVYDEAMALADRLYVTDVDSDVDGDVHFPPLAQGAWHCVEESEPLTENGHRFRFRVYDRRS